MPTFRFFPAGWGVRLALALMLPPLADIEAQTGTESAGADTTHVAPGRQYDTGWLHRVFFGNHYRDLWSTPIEAPILDMGTFAGGLKVTRRGGGEQTKSLRMEGADGKEYQFRSIDKDPVAALPPALRSTAAAGIVRDQTSAGHPVGSLLVPPILEAAGVLHSAPQIFLLPKNESRLGEFAGEFGGMLGTLEERPNDEEGAEFEGSSEVVSTDKLLKELEDSPKRPGGRAGVSHCAAGRYPHRRLGPSRGPVALGPVRRREAALLAADPPRPRPGLRAVRWGAACGGAREHAAAGEVRAVVLGDAGSDLERPRSRPAVAGAARFGGLRLGRHRAPGEVDRCGHRVLRRASASQLRPARLRPPGQSPETAARPSPRGGAALLPPPRRRGGHPRHRQERGGRGSTGGWPVHRSDARRGRRER